MWLTCLEQYIAQLAEAAKLNNTETWRTQFMQLESRGKNIITTPKDIWRMINRHASLLNMALLCKRCDMNK